MEPNPFPVEIFARIAQLCSVFSLSRLLISSKLFYDGPYSAIIQEVDDEYILDELKTICRVKGPHLHPFKTSLACIKSMASHLRKHAKLLQRLSLKNCFYHDTGSDPDLEDFLEEESEPQHPMIPILLARGKQLRHLSLSNFFVSDLEIMLGAVDPSNIISLTIIDDANADDSVCAAVVDFLRKGGAKLQQFTFVSLSASSNLSVLDAILKYCSSLRYFKYGTDTCGLERVDRDAAATYADIFSKIAHKNKETIQAITVEGPARGQAVFSEFLDLVEIGAVKTAEDIDKIDAVCRKKYCIPLCNLMWQQHAFFMSRLEESISTGAFPYTKQDQEFALVLFYKTCTNINKYNVKAIRNCLLLLAHANSTMHVESSIYSVREMVLHHLKQSLELGLLSCEYNMGLMVQVAIRILARRNNLPSLPEALHRCLEINPDLLAWVGYREGLAELLDTKMRLGLPGTINLNHRPFGRADPFVFRMTPEDENGFHATCFYNLKHIRSVACYPSFDPFVLSSTNRLSIEPILVQTDGADAKDFWQIVADLLNRSTTHPCRIEALGKISASVLRRLLSQDVAARSFVRLVSSDWKIVLSNQLLETIYNDHDFELLHRFLEEVAKGSFGFGKVAPSHRSEMSDVLWRYVMAWGDEQYFGGMAKETAKHFPGSAPEWLVEFMEGADLPEDVEYAWDVDNMRNVMLKLRIA